MIDFLLRPWRRNFGPDKAYYRIIDDLFGFVPHNIELYKLALVHKSASLVLEDGRSINNERLEYLGDAVIEAVTSDYIFIEYPDRDEGFMTKLRSKIVSRQSLNGLAVKLGLDAHVISANGAGIAQKHIYGDAFEAMMGAVYLDQGYDFVNRLLINRIYFGLLEMCIRDRIRTVLYQPLRPPRQPLPLLRSALHGAARPVARGCGCLLYTSSSRSVPRGRWP